MAARRFDGTDDVQVCSIGSCNVTFGTFAIILRRVVDNVDMGAWYLENSSNVRQTGIALGGTLKRITARIAGTERVSTLAVAATDGWVLIGFDKATGTTTPRIHKYVFSTGVWSHENATATAADGASVAGGNVCFGDDRGGSYAFNSADYALAGIWGTVLSDSEWEDLADSYDNWVNSSPVGLWKWNQTSTGTSLTDLTGNGANQTSLTGTSVINEAPPLLKYEAGPVVVSTATTIGSTASATPVINLPTTILSGNTLLAAVRVAGAGAIGWPSGWTELVDVATDASDDQFAMAWRKADGTESTTISLSSANQKFAGVVWNIHGADDPTVQPPELSTIATGTSTTPDPTTVTPTGGAKDYLWMWIGSWEGEQTSPPASNPTNYTGVVGADSGTAGAVTTNVRVAGAHRYNNAASEDPGSWTISVSDDWTAYAVAVHPLVAGTPVSQTFASVLEQLAGLVQTRQSVVETLQGLSTAKESDVESLSPVTNTRSGVVESLQGVVNGQASNVESNQILLSTREVDIEARGLLLQTSVVNSEALSLVLNTRQVAAESLSSFASSPVFSIEATTGLNSPRPTAIEAIGTITVSRQGYVEALTSLLTTKQPSLESSTGLNVATVSNVEATTSLNVSKVAAIEALTSLLTSKQAYVEALTGVLTAKGAGIEALTGLLLSTQSGIESLSGLSPSYSSNVEASGSIASSQAVVAEALAGALNAASAVLEALNGILAAKQTAVEALQGLLDSNQLKIESLGLEILAKEFALCVEALGLINSDRTVVTESLSSVAVGADADLESGQTAVRPIQSLLESLSSVARSALARTEATQLATREALAVTEASGTITSARAANYEASGLLTAAKLCNVEASTRLERAYVSVVEALGNAAGVGEFRMEAAGYTIKGQAVYIESRFGQPLITFDYVSRTGYFQLTTTRNATVHAVRPKQATFQRQRSRTTYLD